MRLFSSLVVVSAIGAMAFFASPAFAEVIFQDNFEASSFGTGLSATTPQVGDHYAVPAGYTALTVEDDNSGGKCAYANLVTHGTQMFISPADTTAITGQTVQFNFDYYGASVNANTGSELTAMTGFYSARSFDLYLYGDGKIQYYNPDVTAGGGMVTVGGAGSFATNTWIPVQIVADYATHTFDANVGGFAFSGAWAAAGPSNFDNLFATINAGATGYGIDNLLIQGVPEPSVITLLMTGVFGMLAYAWRKRKQ